MKARHDPRREQKSPRHRQKNELDGSGHDVINEPYTLYGERRFVIECPAPSTTIFLAMKNSIIFISALSLVAMTLVRAVALLHPTRRQQQV
jgi:hypothetical protein